MDGRRSPKENTLCISVIVACSTAQKFFDSGYLDWKAPAAWSQILTPSSLPFGHGLVSWMSGALQVPGTGVSNCALSHLCLMLRRAPCSTHVRQSGGCRQGD